MAALREFLKPDLGEHLRPDPAHIKPGRPGRPHEISSLTSTLASTSATTPKTVIVPFI